MSSIIQWRRGTAADWTSADPILAEGEWGLETDTQQIKVGNGTDNWSTLPYFGGDGITDHGALTGLTNDDHPQYHNDARGDARYYQQSEVDASQAVQDGRLDALEGAAGGTPPGGVTTQVLTKISPDDYDTQWRNVEWADVNNRPVTFPPESHTHVTM